MTTDLLPTEFTPSTADDFYGPAKDVAVKIQRSADLCLKRGAPAAHLFVGASGSGKSALAQFALDAYGVNKWNVTELMGSDITVDAARNLSKQFKLTSMYPGYRAIVLDELDAATKEARNRLLEFIGEAKQPRNTVIVATSNMPIGQIDQLELIEDAQGRFTSRFQVWPVPQPKPEEVVPLVKRWVPDDEEALRICRVAATNSRGVVTTVNVRGLLKDLNSLLVERKAA